MAEYILEAFKQFDLLEEAEESAEFSMNPDDLQDMKTFIDMASGEDEEVDVFDLEAETKEELKDAYVGKVILDCNVCHSNIFYNKEDIEIGDDEIANIGDECPYCMSNEGYTIIGEIKKFGEEEPEDEFEEPEDDIEDIDMEEEPAEDIEVEDEEEFMEEEYLKSSDKLAASKKLKEGVSKSLRRESRKINESDEGIHHYVFGFGDGNSAASRGTEGENLCQISGDIKDTEAAAVISVLNDLPEEFNSEILHDTFNEVYGEDGSEALEEYSKLSPEQVISNLDISGGDPLVYVVERDGENVFYDADMEEYLFDGLDDEEDWDDSAWADEVDWEEDEEGVNESLKADKSPSLKRDDRINGRKTSLKRTLDGSDEIRGPKYKELDEARKNTPAKYKKTGDDIYRKNTEKVEYVVQSSLEDDPDIKVTSESEAKALIAQNKREDKKDPDRKAAGITYSYKKIEESYDEANDVMTPEEAEAYWQENKDSDPILAEYDSYQDWFKDSKENGYIRELDEAIAPLDKDFLFKHYKEVTPKELHDDYMGPTPARLNKESAENVFPGDFEHISWLALAKESRSAIFKAGRSADLDYLELVRDTYNGDNTERLVHAGIKNGKPTIFYVDESEIKKILGDIKESLSEAIEDVSITTEDETMTMTTKEDGGVVVETSPKEAVATAGEELEGEEVIAPLDMDTQEEIEAQDDFNDEFADDIEEVTGEEEVAEDDFDMPMDDFDEESFDELGESYLKECYENVDSFKTSTVKNSDGKLVVEGLIKFNSGNTKATTFTFESMAISKKGKIKLIGENAQICSGKKAFKVRGKVEDNRFISESLNYNYNAKNDDNESVKVSGTVRRK